MTDIYIRTTLPASWAENARRLSILTARASFDGGWFSLSKYELPAAAAATTASRHTRAIIVLLAVVWRVVVAVPLGYVFLVLYFLFSRDSAASFSTT